MLFLLFCPPGYLEVLGAGRPEEYGEGNAITISLKHMLSSFQGVYFNGNHVFPLLIINDHKSRCHLLSCLCNESRTLLISILIRLQQESCFKISLCKTSKHFTQLTSLVSVYLNLFSVSVISHAVLVWKCIIDDMYYILQAAAILH